MIWSLRATLFCIILCWAQVSLTDESFCVSSPADLQVYKAKLPDLMKELPLNLWVDNLFVSGAIKIFSVGDRLKIDSIIGSSDPDIESAYIKSACFKGSELTVHFPTGSPHVINIKGSKSVKIRGQTFEKKTNIELAGLINKVLKPADTKMIPASMQQGSVQ